MNTDKFHIPEELLAQGARLREEHILLRLSSELARSARSRSYTSIVIVHDPITKNVADVLEGQMRPYDICGEGEPGQYIVLLPDTDSAGCEQFVRRIDQQLVTSSLGWATSTDSVAGDEPDAADLLASARSVLQFNQQLSDLGSNVLLSVDAWSPPSDDVADPVEPELG